MKSLAALLCFALSIISARAQVTLNGFPIQDYLVSAVHPGSCNMNYVLGYPDDSIWVNFNNGQRMTGAFGSTWTDVPGNDVLLETGYHQSNYTVRLMLSGGLFSAPHAVATTSGWTQMLNVPWLYTSASCIDGSVPSPRYILPLDFSAHFGLTPTDVVTGIEIVFLTTTGLPDLAGVYIIQTLPPCDTTDSRSDTILCQGQTLLLDATEPNATYLWQDNSTGPTYLVTAPGIYWVQITDSCGTTNDTTEVTYIPAATVDLGNDTALCAGQSLTLDATAPNVTYLWQDNSTNPTFNVTTAGTYWVQLTNSCGSVRDTIDVLYTTLPTVDLGNDTILCTGQSLVLDATVANASYLWQDNSTNPTFTITSQGTYRVQVTNNCGTAADTMGALYLSLPTVNLGNDTALCTGQSLAFDVTASYSTYLWQDNSTNPTFNVTAPGTYWVQLTHRCGIASDTVDVIYNTVPVANLGSDTMVCTSGGFILDATTPSGTYLWQDNSTNPTFTVSTSGMYWVQLTNNCGSDRDTVNVIYASLPTAALGNDTILCTGQSLTLNATALNATYLWQDNSTNPTFTVSAAGTYWVQVSNSCGIVRDTLNVTYSSPPSIDLGNDTTLCVWDTLTLDATAPNATYFWYNGATTPTLDATTTGTYFVRVTNSCGADRDTVVINYRPLPTADLGNATMLCAGESLSFNVLQITATYLWQDNSTNPTFTVTGAGTYWVQVTNSCGSVRDTLNVTSIAAPTVDLGDDTTLCTGENLMLDVTTANATYLWQNNSSNSTFTITTAGTYWVQLTNNCGSARDTINALYTPMPDADLGNDTFLCTGQSLTLDATATDVTYLWQDNSTNATFTATTPGTYWVQVSNSCGNERDTIMITDSAPQVDIGGDTTLCEGVNLILNATTPNATYLWQDNSTNATFIVTLAGTYWVQVTGCGSSGDTIIVTYNAAPSVDLGGDTALCPGETLLLDATTPEVTYRWHDNSNEPTFSVDAPGVYWVEITSCGTDTDSITVTLKNCDCQLFLPGAFSPNADSHNDSFKPLLLNCNLTSFQLMIFNRWGEMIFKSNTPTLAWDGTYEGEQLPLGVYAYVVTYSFNNANSETKQGSVTLVH